LFSAPPGRKQPYRAPQAQNNQNASGNVIAGMHGAAFGASNAAFPRRISRDPPELWSQPQRSALTPLRNVKYSAHFRLRSGVVAKLAPFQSRSGRIADVRFGSKADIGLAPADVRYSPESRHRPRQRTQRVAGSRCARAGEALTTNSESARAVPATILKPGPVPDRGGPASSLPTCLRAIMTR
jgi:hypothetical protein